MRMIQQHLTNSFTDMDFYWFASVVCFFHSIRDSSPCVASLKSIPRSRNLILQIPPAPGITSKTTSILSSLTLSSLQLCQLASQVRSAKGSLPSSSSLFTAFIRAGSLYVLLFVYLLRYRQ